MQTQFQLDSYIQQAYQHQFTSFSSLCKCKRKHHGTMDKSSSEQQFCKSNVITFAAQKFWSHTSSATESYSRQADKILVNFEFLKFAIDQNFFAVFNKVTTLVQQYECIHIGIFGLSLF